MAKITYMGEDITKRDIRTGRYTFKYRATRATMALQRFIRVSGYITVAAWCCVGSLEYGLHYKAGDTLAYIAPQIIAHADAITPSSSFPILEKIAQAESHKNQFCTKDLVKVGMCKASQVGAPLVRVNTNGSYDIGLYQINSTHLADALAHGDDVYTLKGNTDYALYLFTTQGSEPWYSSRNSWGQ